MASKVFGIRRPWAEGSTVAHACSLAATMPTFVVSRAWQDQISF